MTTFLKTQGAWAAPLVALLLAGCASNAPTASADLHPRTLAEVQESTAQNTAQSAAHKGERRPTVALALGGGGLRGFAHVGVLQALEEAGLRPDIVVGTSAGSVVGAAYASGMPVEKIREAALAIKVSSLLDFTWQSGGFIRGDKLADWADSVIGSRPVEDFPIRYAAVATDLQSAQPLLLTRGPAGRVIQASSAVPGVQVPVAYEAGHLIDGGVTSLVPVRFARAMGADLVIAVDIYCRSPRAATMNVLGVLGQVMQTQSCLIAAPELAEADLVIAPTVAVPDMTDRPSQEQAIQAGYQATRAALARYADSAPAVKLAVRPD
jgi:NTE family protein